MYHPTKRRLAVLVIDPQGPEDKYYKVIGFSKSITSDPEFIDYMELLSAFNIPFDIVRSDDISEDLFIQDDLIKYVVTIVAGPFDQFSDRQISILKDVSYRLGVSILTSYLNPDERSYPFFGIKEIKSKGFLRPLKARIIQWPDSTGEDIIVDYGITSSLAGIRKREFEKINKKAMFLKCLKMARSMILPYAKVDLKPHVNIFMVDMKDTPLAWSYQFGKAINYYFALHSDMYLDQFNEVHRLVRYAIERNSGYGMISADLESTMALRLDDPGACAGDYLNNGDILIEKDWLELGNMLQKRDISTSVMYTPCWVDDGDRTGRLYIAGKEINDRYAGTLYNSADVVYKYNNKNRIIMSDHVSEYRGIKSLMEAGLVDIQSHGLTHLTHNRSGWAISKDKRINPCWYAEFYDVKNDKAIDDTGQYNSMVRSINTIQQLFNITPIAFTPSGHRHDEKTDQIAYKAGFLLFSSDYTGIFKNGILIRNWKIPSVFLYLKEPNLFSQRSGYPFVGVVHDYEIKREGIRSLDKILDKWQRHGVKRFISMKNLATSISVSISTLYSIKDSESEWIIDLSFDEKFSRGVIYLRLVKPSDMHISKLIINGAEIANLKKIDNKTFSLSGNLHNTHTTYYHFSEKQICLQQKV